MNIVSITKKEIEGLPKTSIDQVHLIAADVRYVSQKLYNSLGDKSIGKIFSLCEELLEEHNWPLSVIAYDWAYRKRKDYNKETFDIFENWLIKYVRGWGDCDDFCTHAFGELICRYPELFDRVRQWTTREEFWMRRAAAVILIPAIRKGKYNELRPLEISDILMKDEHYLVCKGYGWMLKVLSQKDQVLVFEYLLKNSEIMPRVSYRYALEKMDKEKKDFLMGK